MSANDQIGFLSWRDFINKIDNHPLISMVWGDIGVGKSTLAIQLSRDKLAQNKKIFYLYTKKAPINEIFQRMLPEIGIDMESNLILWNPLTFQQQFDVILQWQLQIQQLLTHFNEQKVGLIVLDEIISLYLLEMGTEKQNEKLNQLLTLQLATLQNIVKTYQIPVILLNSLTIKKDDQDNPHGVAYGGKIVDYWVRLEILLERTAQMSKIRYTLKKNKDKIIIPPIWLWNLSDKGFM